MSEAPDQPVDLKTPFVKLGADMRKAARTLTCDEARWLIDTYYDRQEDRKSAANRKRAATTSGEPAALISWVNDAMVRFEGVLKTALGEFAAQYRVGQWVQSLFGFGPVLSAAMLASFDIRKSATVGGFWRFCFPAGTLIETPDGPVPIETIVQGDEVIGAAGQVTTVANTACRPADYGIVHVKAGGCLGVDVTPEHPFLVCNTTNASRWVEAEALGPGDLVGLRIPTGNDNEPGTIDFQPSARAAGKAPWLNDPLQVNNDIARFLGRFVADGNATLYDEQGYRRGQCAITFGYHATTDKDAARCLAARYFGGARESDTGRSTQIIFGRLTVAETFQRLFGHLAQNKRIPPLIFDNPNLGVVRSFLLGYMAGDGHVVKEGKSRGVMMANTVSRVLALQLQRLLLRFRIFATVHRQRRDATTVIGGREVNQQPWRYTIALRTCDFQRLKGEQDVAESPYTNRRPVWADGYLWTPLVSVEDELFDGNVHNLQTDCGTYIAENIAVHNCGLDPTLEWKKGQKRPYNAKLKAICAYRVGETQVKFWNDKRCYYGQLMQAKKKELEALNAAGKFADTAREQVEAATPKVKGLDRYKLYWVEGFLAPLQIHARARRWAVKLFLSHLHHVMFRDYYDADPPAPFIFDHPEVDPGRTHTHLRLPPGWPGEFDGKPLKDLLV